ncbi:hypothetical protein [Mycobacterium sp.]|uniref:hypothetical protein n=1 Tax=Mycobacterium sp. TaxID=1785 RepID=UPI002C709F82|nr:hypothetical protein [Mycobacterium sp.]HTY31768.1 hypothetical protein [Mycobacterium sp.]
MVDDRQHRRREAEECPAHDDFREFVMHVATIVLSALLAAELAATGGMKVLGTGTARANAHTWASVPGSAA